MKKVLLVLAGVVIGIGGYIGLDKALTPDAVVIEAVEGEVLYSGDFMDADPLHAAKGSFAIKSDGMGGRIIELSNDFEVANAPDPHVKINGTLIAKNNWKGGQVFNIPNLIDEDIKEVVIFCKIAGINLATSSLMMGMDMEMMEKDEIMPMNEEDMKVEIEVVVDGETILDIKE